MSSREPSLTFVFLGCDEVDHPNATYCKLTVLRIKDCDGISTTLMTIAKAQNGRTCYVECSFYILCIYWQLAVYGAVKRIIVIGGMGVSNMDLNRLSQIAEDTFCVVKSGMIPLGCNESPCYGPTTFVKFTTRLCGLTRGSKHWASLA